MVPEVLGPLMDAPRVSAALLLDVRVLSALALLVAARLSGNLLVAIGVGAVVLFLG